MPILTEDDFMPMGQGAPQQQGGSMILSESDFMPQEQSWGDWAAQKAGVIGEGAVQGIASIPHAIGGAVSYLGDMANRTNENGGGGMLGTGYLATMANDFYDKAQTQTAPQTIAQGTGFIAPWAYPQLQALADWSDEQRGYAQPTTNDQKLGKASANMAMVAVPEVAGKITSRIFDKFSSASENLSDSYAKDVLGVKPRNIEQSVKRGVQFVDDQGLPTTAANASDFTSGLERRVANIKGSDLWDKLSNDPKESFRAVSEELNTLKDTKTSLISQVDQGIQQIGQQHGVNYKLKPDWSIAEDYIQNGKGTAGVKSTLTNQLDAIKADWATKSGTFEDLINFKGEVDTGKVFPTGPNEAGGVKLREKVLLGIKNAGEQVADHVLGATDPRLIGAFGKTNAATADLLNIKDLLATKAANSGSALGRAFESLKSLKNVGIGTLGIVAGEPTMAAVGLGASALAKALPRTSSNIADFASSLFDVTSKGTGGLGDLATLSATQPSQSSSPSRKQSAPQLQHQQGSVSSPNSAPASYEKQVFNSLLDAVKTVESGGNPNAVSPAGAKGAYQFTDATAKDYGLSNPFDEGQSRTAAAKKIQADFEHFGDMRLALAAYNAGRGRVDKLLKQTGGESYEDIASLLPAETRKYVPRVEDVFARLIQEG